MKTLEALHEAAAARCDFYERELEIARAIGADRERRLAVALFRAEQLQKEAEALARSEAASAAEALRARDEQRERADWAADERARLAKCYEDACKQAAAIAETARSAEQDIIADLTARADEIAELHARCDALEQMLVDRITAATAEVRAERTRLSELVSSLQQGRIWSAKRVIQRLRNRLQR